MVIDMVFFRKEKCYLGYSFVMVLCFIAWLNNVICTFGGFGWVPVYIPATRRDVNELTEAKTNHLRIILSHVSTCYCPSGHFSTSAFSAGERENERN